MATLALAAAGAAVGSAVLPAGVSVLGATLSGAAIGSQVGSLAGSFIDNALFGASGESRTVEGPRLRDLHVTASSEGSPIPRLYGRARLGGQIIWATDFEELRITTSQSSGGGKGGVGGGQASGAERADYLYYANFAVAIAEGEISGMGRVWADGVELNLSGITYRLYKGGEDQQPDGLIVSRIGADRAPAFRGTAYVVFERLPLADFGNRIPQLSFEVFRVRESVAEKVRSVVLIPGSGEFVYSNEPVILDLGGGEQRAENVHNRQGSSDWQAALDQMAESLPNVTNISLVVSWFGTDLRAGNCQIQPGVETTQKQTNPRAWVGGGVERDQAHVVSLRERRPAYGGTPADWSVIAAIQDLKARGLGVTLTPFILMDVPEGNALADPYGGASQAAYPWRGRITCDPAPGETGSPDQTALAGTQVAQFVGAAQPADFAINGDAVIYSGPAEWSYRRMVLHQAYLAKAAGGVEAFLIGTELRGLTWVRDAASSYPFVTALMQLADDVKSILGAETKVTYAADWSEYFGHQPNDGSGDVYFHLDPLWASSSIDAVGIDCYWPLSDWRDGRAHLDYSSDVQSIFDLDYLKGNVRGGEGYDWYYASEADRVAQVRTPITDGQGKPWVFRYKDIANWWSHPHHNRPGGIEAVTPTAWTPQSKPFWFLEIGCPAVDKGANQPNVFVDPKSSENALPYFSDGTRDDYMQRRHLQAMIEAFDPNSEGYLSGSNPVSSVYGERMVDTDRMFAYCWDARPFPAFPYDLETWSDGTNWALGHWISGRFSHLSLSETVAALCEDFGFNDFAVEGLGGVVPGYVVDRVMSARDALQPLGLAYFFDALESGDRVVFRHRGAGAPVASLTDDQLVETGKAAPLLTLTRGQETELPASAKLSYISSLNDYQQAVSEARRLTGASGRVSQAELPLVLENEQAAQMAESWLFETWASRERAGFSLPPSQLAVEPGDAIELVRSGVTRLVRVTDIADSGPREIEARSIDPDVYGRLRVSPREARTPSIVPVGTPEVAFLDLPLLRGDEPAEAGYVAARLSPWPGGVAFHASPENAGYALRVVASAPATLGQLLEDLPPGPAGRMDYANSVRIQIAGSELQSVSRLQLLSGANLLAIQSSSGGWEVLQFEKAELVEANVYRISGLLRGQAGTETAMGEIGSGIATGATVVLIDGAVTRVNLAAGELKLPYEWRYGSTLFDIGHASYGQITHAFEGVGLRPLAPVHVRATRSGGDLHLSWIRRTRIGGDSWEGVDVPLGEESESYEVDILDGSSVVRTLSVSSPQAVYSASDQIADFGTEQSVVSVTISQINAAWGRGVAAVASV